MPVISHSPLYFLYLNKHVQDLIISRQKEDDPLEIPLTSRCVKNNQYFSFLKKY